MVNSALFSHKTDDWGTPLDLFHKLFCIYRFHVDAAADTNNHLLPEWFGEGGIRKDALELRWMETGAQNFFLNPPYSMCRQFMAKVVETYRDGGNIVVLVPARTDTKWWHESVEGIATVKPVKGRLKFSGSQNSAPFPSVILTYLGALNDLN